MTKFITIGEPLVVFASQEEDKSLDKVEHFKKFLAGAELNVAVGLARLGYQTEYLSQVGTDCLGQFIISELDKRGIGSQYVQQTADYPTGFYLKEKVSTGDPKVEYYRKNSAASHFSVQKLAQLDLSEVKVAHLTGIMAAISENGLAVVSLLLAKMKAAGKTTVFDPNLRPALWKSEELMIETTNQLAKEAEIVLPGVSEGKLLTGKSELSEIADFYLNQSEITQTVVIKNGSKGAYVKTQSGEEFTVAGFKVEHVVDTVGAGDGFAAGFISGLMDELDLKSSVVRACAVGAFAVQSAGDSDGYPTREVLDGFLESHQIKALV